MSSLPPSPSHAIATRLPLRLSFFFFLFFRLLNGHDYPPQRCWNRVPPSSARHSHRLLAISSLTRPPFSLPSTSMIGHTSVLVGLAPRLLLRQPLCPFVAHLNVAGSGQPPINVAGSGPTPLPKCCWPLPQYVTGSGHPPPYVAGSGHPPKKENVPHPQMFPRVVCSPRCCWTLAVQGVVRASTPGMRPQR